MNKPRLSSELWVASSRRLWPTIGLSGQDFDANDGLHYYCMLASSCSGMDRVQRGEASNFKLPVDRRQLCAAGMPGPQSIFSFSSSIHPFATYCIPPLTIPYARDKSRGACVCSLLESFVASRDTLHFHSCVPQSLLCSNLSFVNSEFKAPRLLTTLNGLVAIHIIFTYLPAIFSHLCTSGFPDVLPRHIIYLRREHFVRHPSVLSLRVYDTLTINMPRRNAADPDERLTLEELSAHDDLCTDVMIDNVRQACFALILVLTS